MELPYDWGCGTGGCLGASTVNSLCLKVPLEPRDSNMLYSWGPAGTWDRMPFPLVTHRTCVSCCSLGVVYGWCGAPA